MSALIVDFPQARHHLPSEHHRRHRGSAKRPRKSRAVQFSSNCEVRFYTKPDVVDARELRYCDEDFRSFKRRNQIEVLNFRARYAASASRKGAGEKDDGDDDAFQGCVLTGIEHLLTNDLIEKIIARKKGCVAALLEEQMRQRAAGYYDADGLARAVRPITKRSAMRAQKVGVMQSFI